MRCSGLCPTRGRHSKKLLLFLLYCVPTAAGPGVGRCEGTSPGFQIVFLPEFNPSSTMCKSPWLSEPQFWKWENGSNNTETTRPREEVHVRDLALDLEYSNVQPGTLFPLLDGDDNGHQSGLFPLWSGTTGFLCCKTPNRSSQELSPSWTQNNLETCPTSAMSILIQIPLLLYRYSSKSITIGNGQC